MKLLPVGTIVKVAERHPEGRTYTGRIVGYDIHHTKYQVGIEYLPGLFCDGGSWAFLSEVEEMTP